MVTTTSVELRGRLLHMGPVWEKEWLDFGGTDPKEIVSFVTKGENLWYRGNP